MHEPDRYTVSDSVFEAALATWDSESFDCFHQQLRAAVEAACCEFANELVDEVDRRRHGPPGSPPLTVVS